MKPAVGRTVYIPFQDTCICKDVVFAVGKEGFVIGSILDTSKVDSYRTRLFLYTAYNITWFTDLKKAQKAIAKRCCDRNITFVQEYDDYWEIRHKK